MNANKISTLFRKLNFATFARLMMAEMSRKIIFPETRTFFAQGGEDIHLLDLLGSSNSGFYLDIGSNHPIIYSNTFKLYLQGWNGILVDGNPSLIRKAQRIRKLDKCLHALVSNQNQRMRFYISNQDLFSSVDANHAEYGLSQGSELEKVELQTITLDQIIEQHVEKGKTIDVLSIDVEGHDFQVLKSITLTVNRPRVIVIEDLAHNKGKLMENQYVRYLESFSYQLVSADRQNLYFMRYEEFE